MVLVSGRTCELLAENSLVFTSFVNWVFLDSFWIFLVRRRSSSHSEGIKPVSWLFIFSACQYNLSVLSNTCRTSPAEKASPMCLSGRCVSLNPDLLVLRNKPNSPIGSICKIRLDIRTYGHHRIGLINFDRKFENNGSFSLWNVILKGFSFFENIFVHFPRFNRLSDG